MLIIEIEDDTPIKVVELSGFASRFGCRLKYTSEGHIRFVRDPALEEVNRIMKKLEKERCR